MKKLLISLLLIMPIGVFAKVDQKYNNNHLEC